MREQSVRARVAVLWIAVCALALGACTQPRASGAAQRVPTSAPSRSTETPGLFLHAVHRPGRRPSYLLGTIHLGFGFDEVLTPAARAAFDASTRVWMEADVTSGDPKQLIQAAFLPPNQSLRAIVGDALWRELVARLGAQLPPPVMDRLEPWMPAMILGLAQVEQALGEMKPGAQQRRMDAEVVEAAKRSGKALRYFETVEQQIAVFDSIPLEEQVRELSHALEQDSAAQGRSMLEAFAQGDQQALEAALFDEAQLGTAPGFYDALLFERNARWLPVIEGELEQGGAFIAVGAAHLYGERGILASLAQRGYTIERVR